MADKCVDLVMGLLKLDKIMPRGFVLHGDLSFHGHCIQPKEGWVVNFYN